MTQKVDRKKSSGFTLLQKISRTIVNRFLPRKSETSETSEKYFNVFFITGFTLIELLVVIAIIGVLASIVLASVNRGRQKSYIAGAQQELTQVRTAIAALEGDTAEGPGHFAPAPCVQTGGSNELYLDIPQAGINATDGNFSRWNGPYMGRLPTDPWGNSYIFDTDYTCLSVTPGCAGIPDNTVVRAIHSGGPNGSGLNVYDADNIVLVLCQN